VNNSPLALGAITLLTEDLALSRAFYRDVFNAPLVYEDENSAVFQFAETMINLLDVAAAGDLFDPLPAGTRDNGARVLFTIDVEDVDEECARLAALGVALINGPMDRPWGIRTASFLDPSGHVWEIAHELAAEDA
jgi:catechol 2,3-dioxygenase-like lactoylglutathione lyase family enzyme